MTDTMTGTEEQTYSVHLTTGDHTVNSIECHLRAIDENAVPKIGMDFGQPDDPTHYYLDLDGEYHTQIWLGEKEKARHIAHKILRGIGDE